MKTYDQIPLNHQKYLDYHRFFFKTYHNQIVSDSNRYQKLSSFRFQQQKIIKITQKAYKQPNQKTNLTLTESFIPYKSCEPSSIKESYFQITVKSGQNQNEQFYDQDQSIYCDGKKRGQILLKKQQQNLLALKDLQIQKEQQVKSQLKKITFTQVNHNQKDINNYLEQSKSKNQLKNAEPKSKVIEKPAVQVLIDSCSTNQQTLLKTNQDSLQNVSTSQNTLKKCYESQNKRANQKLIRNQAEFTSNELNLQKQLESPNFGIRSNNYANQTQCLINKINNQIVELSQNSRITQKRTNQSINHHKDQTEQSSDDDYENFESKIQKLQVSKGLSQKQASIIQLNNLKPIQDQSNVKLSQSHLKQYKLPDKKQISKQKSQTQQHTQPKYQNCPQNQTNKSTLVKKNTATKNVSSQSSQKSSEQSQSDESYKQVVCNKSKFLESKASNSQITTKESFVQQYKHNIQKVSSSSSSSSGQDQDYQTAYQRNKMQASKQMTIKEDQTIKKNTEKQRNQGKNDLVNLVQDTNEFIEVQGDLIQKKTKNQTSGNLTSDQIKQKNGQDSQTLQKYEPTGKSGDIQDKDKHNNKISGQADSIEGIRQLIQIPQIQKTQQQLSQQQNDREVKQQSSTLPFESQLSESLTKKSEIVVQSLRTEKQQTNDFSKNKFFEQMQQLFSLNLAQTVAKMLKEQFGSQLKSQRELLYYQLKENLLEQISQKFQLLKQQLLGLNLNQNQPKLNSGQKENYLRLKRNIQNDEIDQIKIDNSNLPRVLNTKLHDKEEPVISHPEFDAITFKEEIKQAIREQIRNQIKPLIRDQFKALIKSQVERTMKDQMKNIQREQKKVMADNLNGIQNNIAQEPQKVPINQNLICLNQKLQTESDKKSSTQEQFFQTIHQNSMMALQNATQNLLNQPQDETKVTTNTKQQEVAQMTENQSKEFQIPTFYEPLQNEQFSERFEEKQTEDIDGAKNEEAQRLERQKKTDNEIQSYSSRDSYDENLIGLANIFQLRQFIAPQINILITQDQNSIVDNTRIQTPDLQLNTKKVIVQQKDRQQDQLPDQSLEVEQSLQQQNFLQ